jgi:hypothetical protein
LLLEVRIDFSFLGSVVHDNVVDRLRGAKASCVTTDVAADELADDKCGRRWSVAFGAIRCTCVGLYAIPIHERAQNCVSEIPL